jgi:phosphohistidine swiveling domain-containing protein
MNTIRENFRSEVAALLPVLHGAYRAIGRYQKTRNDRNKDQLLVHLGAAGETLMFFKQLVPAKKQPYFDAILNHGLSVSDRVIALDIAVGAMHIEFSVPRAYMHRESEELRRALELSRRVETDRMGGSSGPSHDVLVRGIGASPGFATGKAALIRRNSDYRRLAAHSIVVAKMTRTDMMVGMDRIAGIVTDIGGSLCHAAIIARELAIPCVVGTEHATERIGNRRLISVDGANGVVRACGPSPEWRPRVTARPPAQENSHAER